MDKKGVTLLMVTISVVVLAIITGAVIFNAVGIVGKSEMAKFAEELELIEDKMEEYYILTGVYPVLTTSEYTAEQLVALNTIGVGAALNDEIVSNNNQSNTFYLIDFEKIKVKLADRGLEKTPDDIYVFEKDTNTVYYVKGVEIEQEVYFSLVNIANVHKINQ